MVKQRCIICLDNTEYMRNGDYAPTRFSAQQKTAEQLIGKVLRSNPESLCSILSMSNPNIDKSLTDNRQALHSTLTQIPIRGKSIDLLKSLKIAHLALKKRGEEATGEKRVVIFVASPLHHSIEELREIGKMYKRYKIMIDVINFGETTTNQERLEALVQEADTDNTSHILTVPEGPHTLSDMVLSSEILSDGTQAPTTSGVNAFDAMDGDEQYQLALQLSLQEYERDQQRRREEEEGGNQQPTTSVTTSQPTTGQDDFEDDEDEMLRQALAMSLAESMNQPSQPKSPTPTPQSGTGDDAMQDEDDENDEELQAAIRMSEGIDDIMNDEEFLNDIISKTTGEKKDDKKDDKNDKS